MNGNSESWQDVGIMRSTVILIVLAVILMGVGIYRGNPFETHRNAAEL
jgi:hypothetical protein